MPYIASLWSPYSSEQNLKTLVEWCYWVRDGGDLLALNFSLISTRYFSSMTVCLSRP